MADSVLFEFLHTEMVAELWDHDPDSDPTPGRQKPSLTVLEGMGFRVGQALGEKRDPGSHGRAEIAKAAAHPPDPMPPIHCYVTRYPRGGPRCSK
uniref:Trafficking protein particle complex 6A n=1 Tax=Oryctolagus cuniculus TaxID=9986 RepID=A0A5F9CXU0_RABIT